MHIATVPYKLQTLLRSKLFVNLMTESWAGSQVCNADTPVAIRVGRVPFKQAFVSANNIPTVEPVYAPSRASVNLYLCGAVLST